MDLIVPSKVEETKKDAKIRSGDEDEIDTSSQSSQLKSPLNTTTTKSFGVRRIEILQMQYQSPFVLILLFFCIFF